MTDHLATLSDATARIEELRDHYEHQSKVLKLDYLNAVAQAKDKFGTTNVANALGLSRHRIYQIEKEASDLTDELS